MSGVDPVTRVRAELSAKRSAAGRRGAQARWGRRTGDTAGAGGGEAHWCGIQNQDGDSADIYIYGVISRWDVSAKDFAEQLKAVKAKTLNVFINSPGGSVWEGLPILNGLRRHAGTVNVTIDGLAASAASWIAMAGDEVIMSPNSQLMIHDALSIVDVLTMANAADIEQIIEDLNRLRNELERLSNDIAGIYATAAGGRGGSGSVSTWRQLMRDETWFYANEAVSAGLADRVDGDDGDEPGNRTVAAAAADGDEDSIVARFRYASRDEAPGPSIAATQPQQTQQPPAPEPEPEPQPEPELTDADLAHLSSAVEGAFA
ncbi:MAG: head maturation protease, ClpP-related [Actinomycetota bacterium]